MRFSTAAIIAITASSVAVAHPLLIPRGDLNASQASVAKGARNAAGAAFFITNQPEGNFIVGSDIGSDGQLTFRGATSAGGRGGHGLSASVGPDPFFSQGAIKVAGQNVFTVNAGSNTVAMFAINRADPAKLKMVGRPANTGGEFPVSVTISKQTGQVCVLNGGKVNGVSCFKQSAGRGLIPMANTHRSLNLNQTTPPTGPAGTVSHVIFNENGSQLLASVKGVPPTPGFIASWKVDPKTGALSKDFTKSTPAAGGLLPFSMTVIPGKDAILATDAGIGFDIFNFKNGQSASSTIVPIAGQKATCWSSFSRKTGTFFLTDVGTSTVTEVRVDNQLNGSIVKQYPQASGSATIDNDVATVNNKDLLYVLAPGATSVMVLSLKGPGDAQPLQQFNFAAAAKKAGVTIDPNNLQGIAAFVKN